MSLTKAQERWLLSSDTGLSSVTIFRVMTGERYVGRWQDHGAFPYDPSDFGRCYRLLQRFPKWRKRLAELAKLGPEWRRLVCAWPTLEALYRAELPDGRAPRLYAALLVCRGGR